MIGPASQPLDTYRLYKTFEGDNAAHTYRTHTIIRPIPQFVKTGGHHPTFFRVTAHAFDTKRQADGYAPATINCDECKPEDVTVPPIEVLEIE